MDELEELNTDRTCYYFFPLKLRAGLGSHRAPSNSLLTDKAVFIVVLFVNCYVVFHLLMFMC